MTFGQSKFGSACEKVKEAIFHLLKRLLQSPLLLGYLAIGLCVSFIQKGIYGLVSSVVNLFVLGFWAVLIYLLTSKKAIKALQLHKNLKIELCAGIVVFIYMLYMASRFHRLYTGNIQTSFDLYKNDLYNTVGNLTNIGVPSWSISYLSSASLNIMILLIPALLLFFIFGYGFRGMGFINHFWKLTLVAFVLSILIGIPFPQYSLLFKQPIQQTIIIYVISLFINGIPEELFFRGFLLPRFEKIVRNPVNALVITSLLFNAAHIPSWLAQQPMSWQNALLNMINVSQPNGLLFGYLYQRTRSVVPGMILHESITIFGLDFIPLY
jgi:CAAX amino terminal protease family.